MKIKNRKIIIGIMVFLFIFFGGKTYAGNFTNLNGDIFLINEKAENSLFIVKNLELFDQLLSNDKVMNKTIKLKGESLGDFELVYEDIYPSLDGFTVETFFLMYGNNWNNIMTGNYTNSEIKIITKKIINEIFSETRWVENIQLIDYFSNKIIVYKNILDSQNTKTFFISTTNLNKIKTILENEQKYKKREIINTVNQKINNLYGIEFNYDVIENIEDVENYYQTKKNQIGILHDEIFNLIETNYSNSEKNTIENILQNPDIGNQLNDIFIQYPFVIENSTKNNYKSQINEIKIKLLNKNDFLKNRRLEKITTQTNPNYSFSGNTITISGSLSSGTIEIDEQYYSGIYKENKSEINAKTNYQNIGEMLSLNESYFLQNLLVLNNDLNSLGENIYNTFSNFSNQILTLYTTYGATQENLKKITLGKIIGTDSDETINEKLYLNLGKQILNSLTIDRSSKFPIGIGNNGIISYFQNDYFLNYNKLLYTNIDSVDNENGIQEISFEYESRPVPIIEGADVIGNYYGNTSELILSNRNSYELDLELGKDYKIDFSSLKGTIEGFRVFLNNEEIFLKGMKVNKNNLGIISEIKKYENITNNDLNLEVNTFGAQ